MGSIRPRKATELLAILWRRKAVIILVAAAMLLATILIVRTLPNLYESRGLVVVSNQSSDALVVSAQIAAVTQQITSQTQLEQIINKYPVYPSSGMDEASSRLRKAIKTDTKYRGYYPDGPESFTVSYRHPDAKLAQQVTAELVELFNISNVKAREQAQTEMDTVQQELAQVEGKMQEIMATNKDANKSDRSPKAVIDAVAVNTQRMTTTSAMESLKDKQFGLEQQIAALKKQIADQQNLVKQNATSTNTAKGAEGPLLVRKAELQAKLTEYATQYTEKNPKVIQTRTELAEVNRQLAAVRPTEVDPANVVSLEAQELRTNQRELAKLETELEVTRREMERKKQFLATLPATDPAAAFTRMESTGEKASAADVGNIAFGNWSERHRTLLARREGLQKIVTGGGVFQVVDRPAVAQSPVAPNRMLLKLLGLGFGLFGGVLIALLLEFPRLRWIRDERDVDYFLGAPVLALIPETLTPAEHNRAQRLHLAWGAVLLVIAGLLVPTFYLLLKNSAIFQILGSR